MEMHFSVEQRNGLDCRTAQLNTAGPKRRVNAGERAAEPPK